MFLMKEHVGKLIADLKGLIYRDIRPIETYRYKKAGSEKLDPLSLDTEDWEVLPSRDLWGGHREYFYFETEVQIPQEWKGKQVVYELRTGKEGEWDALNPQFYAYVNGEPRMGLDVNHREILLTDCAAGGEQFKIMLSAYSGDNNFSLHMDSEIKILEPEIEGYYYDLEVPYQVARVLPESNENRTLIIRALDHSLRLLDLRKEYSESFFESLKAARADLEQEFYQKYCGRMDAPEVYCVGHTHIDVAWQWTLGVTRDKAKRSFTTVLELMKQYPEYIFMSSQPQLYEYVKEDAPEIYEQIRERIAQRRWEAEGGMWLEADCNLSSGEALVRQFLYGTRFFKKEFGVDNKILWLPDVFGYSAALPQIMKKCGIDYFMTTKISWNERNKMPYDTFLWEGIDGTEVLTHFVPTRDYGAGAVEDGVETAHFTTYNGYLNSSQTMGGWQRYSQKELNREVLMSYGYGDGGGGVTKDMLENQKRLSRGIPGAPKTVMSTARHFFETLDSHVQGKEELPRWVGELYLEYHRGTYTSMARNKKFNRRAEFACEDLELYGLLSEQAGGYTYPKEELGKLWTVLLRNQFHDILPGSSIREVYDESKEEYEKLFSVSRTQTDAALENATARIDGRMGDIVIYNPNSKSAAAPVLLPLGLEHCMLLDGEEIVPLQRSGNGMLAIIKDIPSKGYRTFHPVKDEEVEKIGLLTPAEAEKDGLLTEERLGLLVYKDEKKEEKSSLTISKSGAETPFFKVAWNEKGQFTSVYDKMAERELLPEGKCGNVIMSYEDRPHNFDAWDINHYYTEKAWEIGDTAEMTIEEEGPIRATIRIEHHYLDSVVTQYISFYRDLYQIDIRNEIDWNEKQVLLRCYFPVDVHTDEATYEIQYGNVKRPTHYNTSWDDARFEVCAHKWIDLSEDGYGLSVLNDCKYGCDIHNGRIGLTMLKSAIFPNPDADKEHHSFTWSLCPHVGRWQENDTVAKAYALNNPYQATRKTNEGGTLPKSYSLVSVDAPNVIIETVKKAEDGEGTIIRMYECWNRRSKATLTFGRPITRAAQTNMLEEEEQELAVYDGTVTVEMKPFEIKTVVVY